jgi:carbonic anhydrase
LGVLETLVDRNDTFAASDFSKDLKILPSMKTMIIGCVDPRVDPVDIFGLQAGEAVVIRNVGGRVDETTFRTMAVLRTVAKTAGREIGAGWSLIVLHHTDCGIVPCFHHAPGLLAKYMGLEASQLAALAIDDPYEAVVIDVAALKANPQLPGGFMVSGVVYDVATGRVEVVVPPALLRPDVQGSAL